MSMVPLLFRDWWDEEDYRRPSRLFDQNFGLGLRRDDLINSLSTFRPRSPFLRNNYLRPWSESPVIQRQNSSSTIQQDKEKFQVILDIQQFAPEEITVKTSGRSIVVEGKHEEKQDEHGFISRHFVRRYILPEDHNIEDVISSLSSDGILTVTAPKKQLQQSNADRVIPITQTGPAKPTVQPASDSSHPKVEQPSH
ncbi:hypothetical protein WA026_015162 [Henosepilachna vigintioctopunctata]|uniref:SHSP domain-containing protein n=1 Tax=Henosepilachna vigintioctopunctata TaxID=420089 RepID=A0AAW1TU57_9CUCU